MSEWLSNVEKRLDELFWGGDMDKRINEKIDKLFVEESAKEVLRNADKIMEKNSKREKKVAYTPLIIADEGSGFIDYIQLYASMVDKFISVEERGATSLLMRVFPKDDDEKLKMFFSSVLEAASYRNRFYGTMLISFQEFKGLDLIRSTAFRELLNFVSTNRDNIRFVIHVMPSFSEKDRLIAVLQDIVSVVEVRLEKPGVEMGYAFVMKEFNEYGYGYTLTEDTKKLLKERVIPDLCKMDSYMGFKTLNNFAVRLEVEAATIRLDGDYVIDEAVLNSVLSKMKKEEAYRRDNGFGFGR